MKIHWLLPFEIDHITQVKEVNLASVRLRLGSLIQNIDSRIFELTAGDEISNNTDILIIGKLKTLENQNFQFWIDKIKLAKQNGTKIIIDYTDNHLDNYNSLFYKKLYDALIPMTDRVVVSSNYLRLNLKNYFNGSIDLIEDAIEVPILKPCSNKKDLVKILWFGHASNLHYLIKFIDQFREFKALTNIYVLTSEQGIQIANQSKVEIPKNLNVRLGLWSIYSMIHTAKFCDLSIIPSDLSDKRKAGVSSNRLITSLALGLPTAADMIDSYKDFNKYFVDIRSKKFTSLLEDPTTFHSLVSEAQEKVVVNFTQKAISQKWIEFFSSLNKSY